MPDTMFMPETWEAFLKDYEFKDSKEVYTNGAMLISSLRARQMMEHYTRQKPGRWIKNKNEKTCSECGFIYYSNNDDWNFCPNCGKPMSGKENR